MDDLLFEQCAGQNDAIDKYLSQSITSYGLAQHQGDIPLKLFCGCRDNKDMLLGAAMGTKTLNLFFLSHIYVEEKYRNENIGSHLLANIEKSAKNVGCSILRVNTFNDLSHSFYIKNGLSETIRINNYMKGFDLIFYEKTIC